MRLLNLEQEFHWIGTVYYNDHDLVWSVHCNYSLEMEADYNTLVMANTAHITSFTLISQ